MCVHVSVRVCARARVCVFVQSVHVDRLFTVSYLPSCLLLLLWCVLDTTHSDRWLGAAATRITSCFVAFTFILLLTPLVSVNTYTRHMTYLPHVLAHL